MRGVSEASRSVKTSGRGVAAREAAAACLALCPGLARGSPLGAAGGALRRTFLEGDASAGSLSRFLFLLTGGCPSRHMAPQQWQRGMHQGGVCCQRMRRQGTHLARMHDAVCAGVATAMSSRCTRDFSIFVGPRTQASVIAQPAASLADMAHAVPIEMYAVHGPEVNKVQGVQVQMQTARRCTHIGGAVPAMHGLDHFEIATAPEELFRCSCREF